MASIQITKLDFYDIAKRIVMTWPYSDCKQLDTFTTLDTGDDLELANLGKTYEDFLNGFFWSRKWALGGSDPDDLCKTYPILALEQKTIRAPKLFSREVCYKFYPIFLDVPDCPTCKDSCKRSIDQVDCDLQDMALTFIHQLRTYKLFTLRNTGETETFNLWISQGQVDFWKATNVIDFCSMLIDLEAFIQVGPVEIFPTEAGTTDRARAVTFEITLCTCFDQNTDFDYRLVDMIPKELAKARCTNC